MIVQITKDGPKNCSILIKGFADLRTPDEKILDLTDLTPPNQGWKGLRLDSVVWIIEEKMGVRLWWGADQTEGNFILTCESRNFLRTDEGVPSPRIDRGWKGELWMSVFKAETERKGFLLILDFDKQ